MVIFHSYVSLPEGIQQVNAYNGKIISGLVHFHVRLPKGLQLQISIQETAPPNTNTLW